MSTRVLKIGSAVSAAQAAAQGAKALTDGKLVGFPTETVYGVGVLAVEAAALDRLRELKSRPAGPFSIHVGRCADVERYVKRIPTDASRLMRKAWPGPVTLVLAADGKLPDAKLQEAGLYDKLCADDMIAFRAPEPDVTQLMLSSVKGPVLASSANLAKRPSPRSAEEVLAELDGQIDLLIDAGPSRYGNDSTIVRFGEGGWSVIREGVYDTRTIRRLLKRSVLFVCTGNTCRSPIAAGLARKMLAEQLGCKVEQLGARGIEVHSAGIFSFGGSPATPEAAEAAARRGADISAHRSQKIAVELINGADLVFCMTQFHVDQVLRMAPQARAKVRRLEADADIPDPIGAGPAVYRKTAGRIEKALKCQIGIGKGLP